MKHIMNVVALLSVAGAAYGQIRTQHLRGSDTMAFLTRDIIRHLSLGSLHKKKPAAPVAPSDGSVKNRSYALVR